MDIGFMDRRLALREPTTSTLPSGQKRESFITRATVWARQEVKGGREAFEADKLTSINQVSWIIRYRTDVKADWQVKEGEVEYLVLAVQPAMIKGEFSRRRFLRIITEQKF